MSMTVEEAIEKLEFLNEALNFQRSDADECGCALQMGMDAIKEIQQYRAIGTVSEFRENKNFLEFLYNHIQPNEMEQYLAMYHALEEKGE